MVLVSIQGIQIEFPYQPYEIQMAYMEKVIEALKTKSNALLESPTGTGKTLCLLCASLAWLDHYKAQRQLAAHIDGEYPDQFHALATTADQRRDWKSIPTNETKIIYASRTHAQLAQVMQELKKTPYRANRVAILGSRDQLCIHPQVSQLTNMAAKNKACRDKVKAHGCVYYHQYEKNKSKDLPALEVVDIEELAAFGRNHRVCPYYLSKSFEKSADIIFMPYNYIFDPAVRKTTKLDLGGTIVILDEGHNVGKVCEESYSYEISSVDICASIKEVNRIMKYLVEQPLKKATSAGKTLPSQSATHELEGSEDLLRTVAELKRLLLDFEKVFDEVVLSDDPTCGIVKQVEFLKDLFVKARIDQHLYSAISAGIQSLCGGSNEKDQFATVSSQNVEALEQFHSLLQVVFLEDVRKHHPVFRVYMRNEDVRKRVRAGWSDEGIATKHMRILSVWCLSPGCTMQTIMDSKIQSLIITSGTLTPAEALLKELAIPFAVQLFNPHIIKGSQVWVGVVPKGPDNFEWTSQYKNRDSFEYRRSLGRGISNFLEVIPDGVLVFFSSYKAMQDCVDTWQKTDIWESMERRKECFVEPTDRKEFTTMLANYFRVTREEEKGAAFFAVCRGKVSEGVDFPDVCARGVILTGLPYPSKMEPRIRVKMEYLRQTYSNPQTRTLTADEWYNREAWSAVNQALGRVIRHAQDFGACVLCDYRFSQPNTKKQLSGWLRNYVRDYSFPTAKRSLVEFFRSHSASVPTVARAENVVAKSYGSVAQTSDRPKSTNLSQAGPLCCSQDNLSSLVDDSDLVAMYSQRSSGTGGEKNKKASVFDVHSSERKIASTFTAASPKKTTVALPAVSAVAGSSKTVVRKKLVVRRSEDIFAKRTHARSIGEDVEDPSPAEENDYFKKSVALRIVSSGNVKSSTKPTALFPAVTTEMKKKREIGIYETIAVMKRDLDAVNFQLVQTALNAMRKPSEQNCQPLTEALKRLPAPQNSSKIALMLSRFIPARFRSEYDKFLDKMGYLISLE